MKLTTTWLAAALITALFLSACDRPVVVATPPTVVGVPGPAGPAGERGSTGNMGNTGNPGMDGSKGEPGKAGTGTTVIVVPPASSPSN